MQYYIPYTLKCSPGISFCDQQCAITQCARGLLTCLLLKHVVHAILKLRVLTTCRHLSTMKIYHRYDPHVQQHTGTPTTLISLHPTTNTIQHLKLLRQQVSRALITLQFLISLSSIPAVLSLNTLSLICRYPTNHNSDQGQQFVSTLNTTSRGGTESLKYRGTQPYRCFPVLVFCEQPNFLAAKMLPSKMLHLVIGNVITAIIFQSDHIYC